MECDCKAEHSVSEESMDMVMTPQPSDICSRLSDTQISQARRRRCRLETKTQTGKMATGSSFSRWGKLPPVGNIPLVAQPVMTEENMPTEKLFLKDTDLGEIHMVPRHSPDALTDLIERGIISPQQAFRNNLASPMEGAGSTSNLETTQHQKDTTHHPKKKTKRKKKTKTYNDQPGTSASRSVGSVIENMGTVEEVGVVEVCSTTSLVTEAGGVGEDEEEDIVEEDEGDDNMEYEEASGRKKSWTHIMESKSGLFPHTLDMESIQERTIDRNRQQIKAMEDVIQKKLEQSDRYKQYQRHQRTKKKRVTNRTAGTSNKDIDAERNMLRLKERKDKAKAKAKRRGKSGKPLEKDM